MYIYIYFVTLARQVNTIGRKCDNFSQVPYNMWFWTFQANMIQYQLQQFQSWMWNGCEWIYPKNTDTKLFESYLLNSNQLYFNETYKSRWVVVTSCLGIAICFQYWICRDNLIFQTWLVCIFSSGLLRVHICGNKSKVLDYFFGIFCFTSTRFTAY